MNVMRFAVQSHRHWQQDWISSCDLPESVSCPINLLVFQYPHPACGFSLPPYASCLLLQLLPLSKAANELHVLHSWKKKNSNKEVKHFHGLFSLFPISCLSHKHMSLQLYLKELIVRECERERISCTWGKMLGKLGKYLLVVAGHKMLVTRNSRSRARGKEFLSSAKNDNSREGPLRKLCHDWIVGEDLP